MTFITTEFFIIKYIFSCYNPKCILAVKECHKYVSYFTHFVNCFIFYAICCTLCYLYLYVKYLCEVRMFLFPPCTNLDWRKLFGYDKMVVRLGHEHKCSCFSIVKHRYIKYEPSLLNFEFARIRYSLFARSMLCAHTEERDIIIRIDRHR